MFSFTIIILAVTVFLILQISASPTPTLPNGASGTVERRTEPTFPSIPPSCGICQQNYASISSCAQAAPVLANVSMIIFNPGAFIDVIKCACSDTFQSTFPQCVDCFIQSGQEDVLNTPDLPGLVQDVRNICGLESTLLGNASAVDNTPTPPTASRATMASVNAFSLLSWLGITALILASI